MAQNGRVNPDCSYAPNPYHECTEACLRKIRETPPQKNKKSSGAIPLKFGWKKKLDSKPESPVIDKTPASKVRASYRSEKKKAEPKTNEHITSEPVSIEKHIQDVMPVYQKDQAKDDIEHWVNNHAQTNQEDEKEASDKVAPSAYANSHTQINQEHEKEASDKVVPGAYADNAGECLTASAGRLLNYSLSGISITNGNEDSDEETESVASEPRVPVGRYHVREIYAPILCSIFDKYGDIGASFQLESVVMRTYYIECVCFVVQELQSTPIMEFTKSKVKELLAILKDVESAQLQVAWLRSIVNEVGDYIKLINQHQAVGMAKANSESEIESLREELESELKTLAQKEDEVAAIKTRIAETRDRLSELELKSSELDKSMSMIKSKVDSLDGKSLIEELL